jgi:hypothetical protein
MKKKEANVTFFLVFSLLLLNGFCHDPTRKITVEIPLVIPREEWFPTTTVGLNFSRPRGSLFCRNNQEVSSTSFFIFTARIPLVSPS